MIMAERISNINCKTTISEFTIGNGTSAVYVKDNRLIVDSMGNEVMSIDLPEGSWTPIAATEDVEKILLYNSEDSNIYKVENGQLTELYSSITDLQVFGNQMYFVSDEEGYFVSSWIDETEPEKGADGAYGVSHYAKFPGFVTEAGDHEINGVNITVR